MHFSFSLITKFIFDLIELFDDDSVHSFWLGEDVFEIFDEQHLLSQLIFDLLSLETREFLELHLQDSCCLDLGKFELCLKVFVCFIFIFRLFDGLDDGINIVESNFQSFEDVCSGLCNLELILSSSSHNFLPMHDKLFEDFLEVEEFWLDASLVQGNHVKWK